MKRLRIYTDTSVFGGMFDEEFAEDSKRFFDEVKEGRYRILISDVTLAEIQKAPLNILQFFLSFPEEHMEHLILAQEAIELRDQYIQAGALPPACLNDAAHVALAAIAEADIVLSWNFKHLVNFERIRKYNAVNSALGYKSIEIRSPKEVLHED